VNACLTGGEDDERTVGIDALLIARKIQLADGYQAIGPCADSERKHQDQPQHPTGQRSRKRYHVTATPFFCRYNHNHKKRLMS
jgi:hypothetical protein